MISRLDVHLSIRMVIVYVYTYATLSLLKRIRTLSLGSACVSMMSAFLGSKTKSKFSVLSVELIFLVPIHIIIVLAFLFVYFEDNSPTSIHSFTWFVITYYGLLTVSIFKPSKFKISFLVSLFIYLIANSVNDKQSLLVLLGILSLYFLNKWFLSFLYANYKSPSILVAYAFRKRLIINHLASLAYIYLEITVIEQPVYSFILFFIIFSCSFFSVLNSDKESSAEGPYIDVIVTKKHTILSKLSLVMYMTCIFPSLIFVIEANYNSIVNGLTLLLPVTIIFLFPKVFINYRDDSSPLISNVLVLCVLCVDAMRIM
jgi:hypothetical protein